VNDVMRFSYNMFTCIQGQKTLKCSHTVYTLQNHLIPQCLKWSFARV